MTTWICRRAGALFVVLALAGCEDLSDIAGTSPDALPPPLRDTQMMQGAITLVPPKGFCIDPTALNQTFAMMARCDVLGATSGSRGAPLAILTVSFSQRGGEAPLPSADDFAQAAGTTPPQELRNGGDFLIFATTGAPPLDGLDDRHWRAVARVNGLTMGASLYGPQDRRAISVEGADLLEEMVRRTIDRSVRD